MVDAYAFDHAFSKGEDKWMPTYIITLQDEHKNSCRINSDSLSINRL